MINLHTHSTFCDGINTPEEIVLGAIAKGMPAVGFSGHGYTPYDLRYCMKDTEGYRREILRLKEKYRGEIEIYLGLEEDAFHPADRTRFDYIIGSCHYFCVDGEYYPIDSSYDYFKRCLHLFDHDPIAMTHAYFGAFCKYINARKPDIVGHFDLITKFDDLDSSLFLENKEYLQLSERYMEEASRSGCIFEVNTGAISRGYRKTPYPNENLLHILKKNGNGLILSADSHAVETLDYGFAEMCAYLRDLGFRSLITLRGGNFCPIGI